MPIPIRVLIVEDSLADAELMLDNLADYGFAPQAERVETEAAYLAGLNAVPDVILADYRLPQFSGPRALKLLNARAIDIPFIAVSGTISDVQAANLIKAGASDFLLKDRMARLGPAVTQALELKVARDERRRNEATLAERSMELEAAIEKLRESEDLYRDLVENSQDLICTHDLEGKLLSVNAAAVRLTGYAQEALLRMNMADLLTRGTRDGFAAYLNEVRTAGAARGLMRIRTAGGETRWWEYHNTLRTQDVAAPVVRGMAKDITERKQAEDALLQQTGELRARNEELTRFNRVTADRELRMIALKQEVNDLAAKLDLPQPYALAFMDAAAAQIVRSVPKPTEPQSFSEPSQASNQKE